VKLGGSLLANPAGRRLVVVSLIDSAGSGAYVSAGVVLFSTVLGLSASQIGQGFALASAVGMVVSVWWGALADRIGVRRVLLSLQLWRAVGCAALVFANGFASYVAILVFLGIAERASQPILLAFITQAIGESERVRIAGAIRAVRNAGYAVGALASSLALISPGRTSLAVIVLSNSASFVLAAALLRAMPLRTGAAPGRGSGRRGGESVRRRPAFLAATVLSGALSVHRQILAVGLPLWIVTRRLAPTSTVSVLAAVNTVLVVVLQVRMSRDTQTAVDAAKVLRRSGWALFAVAGILAVSVVSIPSLWSRIGLLFAATVALTFAEMWQAAGAWGISLALSPDEARGRFLSVFNLGPSTQDVVGALLLTALVLPFGAAGWLLLGGFLVAGGLLAPPVARWADREREQRVESPVPVAASAVIRHRMR
jgi:hypothetical protein